jgi:hypothetical protein
MVSLEIQVRQKIVCRDKRSSLFTGSTIVLIKRVKTKLKLLNKLMCFSVAIIISLVKHIQVKPEPVARDKHSSLFV